MSTTVTRTTILSKQSLSKLYATLAANANDVLQKLEILKNCKHANGLAVGRYPSGTTVCNLEKVCKYIETVPNFATFESGTISESRNVSFILVRNESQMHSRFERIQKETGGINSNSIEDLGDFLILETIHDVIINGADFSLYKIKDDVII
ncbi:hypothetical protein K8Q96_01245 [Candidatus Nomurabacteria bacterium]|nr:hypothetical protein [Candidatus Nomurabacteria bacterium]